MPEVEIERLNVKWPADDDNLWFIRSGSGSEVQIECGPESRGPYVIEGDDPDQRTTTEDFDEAVNTISRWLGAD